MDGKEQKASQDGILRGSDGVYRWVHELKLLKNPSILFVVWKILGGVFVGIWLFVMLLSMGDSNFWWYGFFSLAKVFALLTLGMLALCLIGYLFYAALMGGKYCVQFEMDEHGIRHTQITKQFKRARVLSAVAVLLGARSGNIGAMGAGLLSGSRQSMYSRWSSIKSVDVYPRRNLIKLNAPLNKNQVYVRDEDFAFVRQYILSRCPGARLRE